MDNMKKDEIKVGMFANQIGYSDIHPNEITKVISNKTIEIRTMDSELFNGWKPEVTPGGFAGHCTNNATQKWNITSNKDGFTRRVRLHKDGKWRCSGGNKYSISNKASRHHDYNF